jgi:hypothetical protein
MHLNDEHKLWLAFENLSMLLGRSSRAMRGQVEGISVRHKDYFVRVLWLLRANRRNKMVMFRPRFRRACAEASRRAVWPISGARGCSYLE